MHLKVTQVTVVLRKGACFSQAQYFDVPALLAVDSAVGFAIGMLCLRIELSLPMVLFEIKGNVHLGGLDSKLTRSNSMHTLLI